MKTPARRAPVLLLACSLAAAIPVSAHADPPAAPSRAPLTLVVLGTFPAELLDAIERALREELQVDVRRGGQHPLPRAAWYPPRRRYRADRILDHLHTLPGAAAESATGAFPRMIAFTDVDVSTTKGDHKDWGVFGLGEVGGRSAVISSFRLRRNARGPEHLRRRIVDVALHEAGHALGLPHCTEPRCLMLDAEGSIQTVDTSSGHIGPACRAQLDQLLPAR